MSRIRFTLSFLIIGFFAFQLSGQCPITVNAGEDVYLCPPLSPVQLQGDISGDYLSFNWSPMTGMVGGSTLNPTVTVTQTTSYVLTGIAADFSNNLIQNGDFEGGNSGFTSDYGFSPGDLVPEGLYDVIDNPQADHPGFAPCDDHTSGDGNMMVVNGAGTPNQDVWCQTVNVMPNTNYVFSAWVTSVVASSPALLQFNINGSPLGPIFNAPGSNCVWQNYFQIWNSGGNSTATICIVNQNTNLGGNDFALDDLFFNATCSVTDTVKVNVVNVNAVAAPSIVTIPCEGATVQLSGNGSSTGPNVEYEWTTGNGNIVSGANTLTPTVDAPGEYTLTVSYVVNGNVICSKTATVNVVLNPNPLSAWISPVQPLGCGSPTSLIIGNTNQAAFAIYEWSTIDGNILGSTNQKNITVDEVGTYTLIVTNSVTGCTASTEVTVIQAINPPTSIATSNGIITCVNDSVPLFGTGSSSGPNFTYNWTTVGGQITGPTNSLNTSAGAGGTYILNVTNISNNCITSDTVVVPSNTTPPTVVGTLPPQLSCDPNQDTISIFINVGPPAFVLINWTTSDGHIVSGQYTPAPQADQPGTYAVSVFDPANGCYNFDTSQVHANFTIPIAQILPADTITCQSPSIELEGSGSSVGNNFSIQWNAQNGGNIVSGDNTLNPTVNAAGDYWLILRDSVSLCADTAMVSVQADTNVVVAIANAPDTLTCVVDQVNLNTIGSSNSGNLNYQWTTVDGNFVNGQNSPNPTVDAPGTYQLLLTNLSNGCSAIDLAVVAANTGAPPISVQTPGFLTCTQQNTLIQGQNGSVGNFLYQWTASNGGNIVSGDTTLQPVVDQPGLYTLVATNLSNGCTATQATNVQLDNTSPTIVIASPGLLTCTGLSQTLSATGSSAGPEFSYSWTTPDGNIQSGGSTLNPVVNEPGTYTLQIVNANNGCVNTSTVLVLQDTVAPAALVLSSPDTLTCLSTQLELIGDGTGTGVWSTQNGNILFTSGFSAQVDAPGLYLLTTTDPNNGCTATSSVVISENIQIPGLTIAPPAALTCLVNTIPVNATGSGQSLQYNWQTVGGNILSGQNSPGIVVDAPGQYTVTVTDGQNGCTLTAAVNVAEDVNLPVIQIVPPATITCDEPMITVQGQNLSLPGNFSYSWTASGGANIVSGANSLSPVIDAGGVVTFSCFNVDNGCSSTQTVNIAQNTVSPLADAGLNDTLSCLNNALVIQGSGSGAPGLIYSWTTSGGGNILSGGNTPTPSVNQAGIYTLTVENPANGCIATDQVQIFNDLNAPVSNAGTAATLTCSVLQTTLNGSASTGQGFSYQWTASNGGNIVNGANTLTPLVNEPGVYTLAVTNAANGCVATSSVTVPENVTPPAVEAGTANNLTCAVQSLSLAGSTTGGPATYLWTTTNGNLVNGANTLSPQVNQTGIYTLTATLNSNGCTASDVVEVGIDTLAPGFMIQSPGILTCTVQSTTLQGQVQQPGAGNFTAIWSTADGNIVSGSSTLTPSVDEPGAYVLAITSALNGCLAQQVVQVQEDVMPPIAVAAPGGNLTCTIQSLSLSGTGSSTGSNMAYQWTASNGGTILSGANTLSPVVGSTGTYTLTVINNTNGCESNTSTDVGSNTVLPIAAIASPQTLTCVQTTVVLDGSGSSQGASYQANWATSGGNIVSGQGTYMPTVNEPGNYLLTVTNTDNGCEQTAQILVQENINTPGALILPAAPLHCNKMEIFLLGSSPTIGPMQYSWTATNGGNILTGDNTPTPMVNAAGSYTLRIVNPDNGCQSETTLVLESIPDPVFVPAVVQPNCFITTGLLNFGQVSGGLQPYRYSIDGGINYSDQTAYSSLPQGAYGMVVEDANGCKTEVDVAILQPFVPVLDIADIQKIDQGDSIQLAPITNIPNGQIASWKWTPAEDLSCDDCANPWAKPLFSRHYTVRVEDEDGCAAEERILVQVSRKRHIYPPNVFTPNQDGENDYFTLYAKGVVEIRKLAVFDRWGEQLFVRENFQPNDESLGWDGSFNGEPMNPGVYVWYAEVVFVDGESEVLYGDVTILR
ncbi:MAG: gliding motility-associated C-terminal domain-containing protein [Chitinophagales bacterium]|nr:gliding motility-associated C-terminal domain-containing protein [Chitinophagales bacterium]